MATSGNFGRGEGNDIRSTSGAVSIRSNFDVYPRTHYHSLPTPWPNFNDLNVIKAASTLNLTTITLGPGVRSLSVVLTTPVEISVDKVIINVLNRPVENF